jgi:glutamate synthase (NADPH/NADH) small chain
MMAVQKNMSLKKNPMPSQDPKLRSGNFDEVALGYTQEQALDESRRCLSCKNKPCVSACPVNIDIPAFIAKIQEEDFEGAYQEIARYSLLPAICGRVCPQETQCEGKCVRGIKGEPVGIGRLERYIADWHMAYPPPSPPVSRGEHDSPRAENEGSSPGGNGSRPGSEGRRVAIVGSGPAGLTCAAELARKGYRVTIFEALHKAGGVLVYGIPEFRLPKERIVQKEIDGLISLGVEIKTNVVIGKTLTVDELLAPARGGYEAVFIASGAGLPMFMNIPGENLCGVYSANEFLTRINLMGAWKADAQTPIMRAKKVAVVGGGNVAMDAARCARRLGAEVTVVYRRTEKELPARREEVEHAMEEGVVFMFLTNPVKIDGYKNPDNPRDPLNGWVTGITCIEMKLGEADASGRARPIPIEGSDFDIAVDCVIMALGTSPNPLIRTSTPGLEADKRGCLKADENGLTTREKVWCGGDAHTGAATVILAMGAGKTAAAAIDKELNGK